MRLLVFCGSRAAIERFDMESDWQILVSVFPQEQRAEIIAKFLADPHGRLAVDRSAIFGWGAPHNTAVLFDPSWPYPMDSSYSLQAIARRRPFGIET